jgi:hypothetical protein
MHPLHRFQASPVLAASQADYSSAEVIPGTEPAPAQCCARQLLTGDNRAAPTNNLHIKIRDGSRKKLKIL